MNPYQSSSAHSGKTIALWQALLFTTSLCLTSLGQTATFLPLTGVSKLWSGGISNHSCVLTTNGGVKCWGYNQYGQLGNGTTTNSLTPIDITGFETSGAGAIALGEWHTCALTTSDGMKCWGGNYDGQLGNGTTTNSSTPIHVTGFETNGAGAITLGSDYSCVLTTIGGVKCWGDNYYGQLNNGTTTNGLTPVDVTSFETGGAAAIALGGSHTCVLTTNGGVKCWGSNSNGQLGNGTTTNSSTPVDVTGFEMGGAAAIALGGGHTCALTTTGGVKCWGSNYDGQLGNGTTTNSSTPIHVTGFETSGAGATVLGMWHACALTTSGGVKCWGNNQYGQLGNGTITTKSSTPVEVKGFEMGGALAIALGISHTCVLTTSRGVKCWGNNFNGQLGNGTTTYSSTPVDVVVLGPDLELLGKNNTSIPSGHLTPTSLDGTDFGQVDIETQTTQSFTLQNPVEGTTITFRGSSSQISCSDGITPTFNLVDTPITPSTPYVFNIGLTPHTPSVGTCTVTLVSDDPDENPYTFTLQIQGIDHSLPSSVDGTTIPGNPSHKVVSPAQAIPPSSATLPSLLTLWVAAEGSGEGSVISQEGKINCTQTAGSCQARYQTGTPVILTPIAAPGSYFSSWGGNENCAEGRVQLWSSMKCTAYFHANTPPTAQITVDAPVQINQPVQFSGRFTDPETDDTHTFTWDFGDQHTAQTQNPSHTYTQAGAYSVIFTVTDQQGGIGTDQRLIEVKPGEIPLDVALPQTDPELKILSSTEMKANTVPVFEGPAMSGEATSEKPASTIQEASTEEDRIAPPTPETGETTDSIPQQTYVPIGTEGATLEAPLHPILPSLDQTNFPEATMGDMPLDIQLPLCPTRGFINWICNAQGRRIDDLTVGTWGNLSNGILVGTLNNQGWVSNLTVDAQGILKGGIVTGYILNQSTIIDITFVGMILQGGTLAGTILNESRVGGILIDVTFAPHAYLKGGKLQGQIRGDQNAPALLENVKVLKGSTLSGIKLGKGVWLEEGVKVE